MTASRAVTALIGFALFVSIGLIDSSEKLAAGRMVPPAPSDPSPADGAIEVSAEAQLAWQDSGATLGYDFYLGTTTEPELRGTTMTPDWSPDMKPATTYYWRVVARDSEGSTMGPLWTFTTANTPTPPPGLCSFGSWKLVSADPWSTCTAANERTRNEFWERVLLRGAACGPLNETRVPIQACTPPPDPPPPPPAANSALLGPGDFIYEGAFRVPAGSGTETYEWGGTALAYHPGHNSLLLVGHDWFQRVGEISIPSPGMASTVDGLPRAEPIQPPTDVLDGKLTSIDGDIENGVKIGGLLPVGNSLVVTAWSYYDAGPQKQTKTHFQTGQDFSALGNVTGPFQVGIGFQDVVPWDKTRIGGFVSGYMSTIPGAWQGLLGGTHLTGQGGGVSILSRTSSGPSATVFNAAELGVPNSPTKLVMGYPSDSSDASSPLDHPSLGIWGLSGIYDGTQVFRGMVFPDETRTILFFGWGGSSFCYGLGTDDPALHMQPVPGWPGVHYCYDPVDLNKGTHGYPNTSTVWAYDVNDFIAVKQGTRKSWEVVPYGIWNFQLPFQSRIVNGVDLGVHDIVGAAYDPGARRIFLAAYQNDGAAPLIHVFRVVP